MSDTPHASALPASSSRHSSDDLPSLVSADPPSASGSPGPATTGNTEPSRLQLWARMVMSRLNRTVMILIYPFMVILTVASLLMVITFCIFPTLICMTFGVCIYYCVMEDPIPLSVLLRYMLSPETDDNNYPHPYPRSQNRGAIQAKLIIRKVLRIEDVAKEEQTEDENEKGKKEELPRRHPFPIEFKTKRTVFHFSEPIVYEEKDDKQEDRDTDGRISIPHYQRTDAVSNNLADEENSLVTLSSDFASPPTDEELGLVEIAIGAADNDDTLTEQESEPDLALQLRDETNDDDSVRDIKPAATSTTISCDEESSRLHDAAEESASSAPEPSGGVAATVTGHLEEVMEVVEDYFGISDSRERGTTCDICLLDYAVDEEVAWSPNPDCVHSFHKECILDWLIRKPSCPSCRNNYLDSKNDNNA